MTAPTFMLRPYRADDEETVIALWRRTWQATYPGIDFLQRLKWWRARWRGELVPRCAIVVAEGPDEIVGFVTIERASGDLDQIVVAPEYWGSGVADKLLEQAKKLSSGYIDLVVNTDNLRALRFYRRNGFDVVGEDVNALSGRRVFKMSWRG
jgi:putative acetyltransferase